MQFFQQPLRDWSLEVDKSRQSFFDCNAFLFDRKRCIRLLVLAELPVFLPFESLFEVDLESLSKLNDIGFPVLRVYCQVGCSLVLLS